MARIRRVAAGLVLAALAAAAAGCSSGPRADHHSPAIGNTRLISSVAQRSFGIGAFEITALPAIATDGKDRHVLRRPGTCWWRDRADPAAACSSTPDTGRTGGATGIIVLGLFWLFGSGLALALFGLRRGKQDKLPSRFEHLRATSTDRPPSRPHAPLAFAKVPG